MKFIFLSYQITDSMPLYGDTPYPKIESYTSIEDGDVSNSSLVTLHTHTGTHIDFPRHFIREGKTLSDYQASDFIFSKPLVIDIPKGAGELIGKEDLEPHSRILIKTDLVLIRTGFFRFRGEAPYKMRNPGISSCGIRFLRANFKNIRALGFDIISISSYQHREEGRLAHREAFRDDKKFGRPLMLIEDLDFKLDLKGLIRVLAFPLFVADLEAAPCTVIGTIE